MRRLDGKPRTRVPEDVRWARFLTEGTPDECWEWRGALTPFGYGTFTLDRPGYHRQILAHRAALIRAGVEIPPAMCVLHRCDNPPCVNPAHLYVGDRADNARDCSVRGRTNKPRGETHWGAKLTAQQVREIRLRATNGEKYKRMAPEYGVHHTTISRIARGIHRKQERPTNRSRA